MLFCEHKKSASQGAFLFLDMTQVPAPFGIVPFS